MVDGVLGRFYYWGGWVVCEIGCKGREVVCLKGKGLVVTCTLEGHIVV